MRSDVTNEINRAPTLLVGDDFSLSPTLDCSMRLLETRVVNDNRQRFSIAESADFSDRYIRRRR